MDAENTAQTGSASNDKEIAKRSGECCLAGTIHEGEPRGKTITIADLDTYIVEPAKGKDNGHIMLYYPDVYGMFVNGYLIMDGFADAGFTVLGIDYFKGDGVQKHRKFRGDPDFDFQAWLDKHMEFSNPATPKWNAEVKAKYGGGNKKFACVGYCYGAPYVCDSLARDGVCTVGAFAHPAFLKESHFENISSAFCLDFRNLHSSDGHFVEPLFLSCAEIDHTFPNEYRNRAVDILQAGKKPFQVQLFQGVEHGFALRGDPNNPYERYVKEQSLKGIAEWCEFWLSQ
ncbi:hypothetical protein LTR78_005102 [Recurvomyces mirabilis]|uniref:Dienelactone hydrolase domain-containing protein n=1 Tax=Recurvomyces mirabilis TaxID=574656 RepID=A0AAE0WNY3_9PEZI|nr:hypothetical protein LTR78_005102 [Recurvomyces mirabilis]KAK5158283.1 hypothetical protein LTS14_003301 [Recurvomyces mirabilis]